LIKPKLRVEPTMILGFAKGEAAQVDFGAGQMLTFARGPRHAGFGLILRVPPLPRHGAE
jgi:hypothetical protein